MYKVSGRFILLGNGKYANNGLSGGGILSGRSNCTDIVCRRKIQSEYRRNGKHGLYKVSCWVLLWERNYNADCLSGWKNISCRFGCFKRL